MCTLDNGLIFLRQIQPKKLVKSNKSKKLFDPKPIFCNFINGHKSIFEVGKSLKLPKIQFHKIDLFDFTIFLPGLF